jgi:hypothetical protein
MQLWGRCCVPFLVCERRAVQLVSAGAPVWQEAIHELCEALAMSALEEVRHLVHDNVLQAEGVLLGQLDVEPEPSSVGVAGAPLG